MAGFSLVEVLFACTLLALALVPIAKAMNNNRKASEAIKTLSLRMVAEGSKSSREDAAAAKEKAAGNPAANVNNTSSAASKSAAKGMHSTSATGL